MIKVIIKRAIIDNMEAPYTELIKQLMQQTIRADGFLSGETLRDVYKTNCHVSISNWRSLRDWERWYTSDERRELIGHITPLTLDNERITVCENVY